MKRIIVIGLCLFFGLTLRGFGQTVYASSKGQKYHTADCSLSGDAEEMKLSEAKKIGKVSCNVCKPDEHLKDKVNRCTGKTADGKKCKRMTASKNGTCYQHSKS